MSDTAIKVENLSKKYHIGRAQQRHDTLRDALVAGVKAPFERLKRGGRSSHDEEDTIWALKDISFEVKRGEVVGVIGRNGAGKSTLLKILSQITEPTSGRAVINGRVGSLLEVGTGFHQELTGRENIYLSGAILGMRREEIDRKFDEIIDFSGVEKFIDTPVKRYSSGMKVRLGFAVAAHMDPEILLVDEVLAVGDATFQKKCLGRMTDIAKYGRTILFVSHNLGAISSICDRATLLESGQVSQIGRADRIVSHYLSQFLQDLSGELDDFRIQGYGKTVYFSEIRLNSEDQKSIQFGEPIELCLKVHSSIDEEELQIGSSIFNSTGQCIGSLITEDTFSINAGQELHFRLRIANPGLVVGSYYMGVSIGTGGLVGQREDLDAIVGKPSFQITPGLTADTALASWNPKWGNIVLHDSELIREK